MADVILDTINAKLNSSARRTLVLNNVVLAPNSSVNRSVKTIYEISNRNFNTVKCELTQSRHLSTRPGGQVAHGSRTFTLIIAVLLKNFIIIFSQRKASIFILHTPLHNS